MDHDSTDIGVPGNRRARPPGCAVSIRQEIRRKWLNTKQDLADSMDRLGVPRHRHRFPAVPPFAIDLFVGSVTPWSRCLAPTAMQARGGSIKAG